MRYSVAVVGVVNGRIMASISAGVIMAESASGRRRGGFDGTSIGRPSAMSNSELAPSCTSCAPRHAPWAWTRSASAVRPGTKRSSEMAVWHGAYAPLG